MQETKITLDKTYDLRFDFNTLALYEEITGKSILITIQTGDLGFFTVRNLIWAALVEQFNDNDRELSPKTTGDLIQDHWVQGGKTFKDLTILVLSAIRASGLIAKKTEEKNPAGKSKRKSKNTSKDTSD